MKKLATIAVLATGGLVLPAQAKPPHPAHPAHPNSCTSHSVGYRAGGTLMNQGLTQTGGLLTATKNDDRYTGDVRVDVKKAIHGAPRGLQIFSLVDAKAKFHVPDRNNDGQRNELDDLQANDRVTLHGKIAKLHHGCSQNGVTPRVNKVDFNKPKPAHPATTARP